MNGRMDDMDDGDGSDNSGDKQIKKKECEIGAGRMRKRGEEGGARVEQWYGHSQISNGLSNKNVNNALDEIIA